MRPLDGYNGAETMCGIAAVLLADSSGDVNTMLFDALTVLQHRGQDAAGMVTCELSPPHRLHLRPRLDQLVRLPSWTSRWHHPGCIGTDLR